MNAPLRLRMDKSKYFSAVHGDRPPGDPHAAVHFYQDGLPFNAQGVYVDGHLNDDNDEDGKLRVLAERRLRKQSGNQTPADADAEVAAGGDDVDEDVTTAEDVNLELWATGHVQYIFGIVRAAIKKRYSIVVRDQRNAIETLVDFKLVTEDQLAPAFKKLLGP